nr:integrase, catalytic region, zinc finger, CCHC-type, peptidase aspartic, catalytic [Tanacetum cinerariifolium]
MINSIKNGDQPLPRVTQVSIAGTSSTEQPPLKDKSMWSDQEKMIQKIDHLARSLLIQGLSNDIDSLIDSNKTAKDLWDALARHMLGSEYGEQDRKAAVLYEYETFKATEGELMETVCNNDETKKNLMDINIDAFYNILKQNQGDVYDAMGSKKKTVVVTSDPLALIAEKQNDSDQEINANMVFMAQIEKVLSDSEASSSSADEKNFEVSYYSSESESESEFETSEYYDNSTDYGLFVNNDDDQEIFYDAIEFASKNFIENHIDSQKDYDKSDVDHNDSEEKDHLVDKMCDLLDDNNFFIFDDESIKISPVSKMPFRKKPRDSMNIVQICLWIIKSGCSKHMTGNRSLLTNFVEKFLGTVRFGNNDFAVIAGYGDVVIGSMTIKKVYYVEGLGHNLFSDVGKLKAKEDIGVFVGYSKESVAVKI